MDFLFAIKLLFRHKWLLMLIPILCMGASFFLTENMKPEFKSVAKLATRFTTEDRITVTGEHGSIRDADVKFNNLVETMSSELIVSMLSYRLAVSELQSDTTFRKPSPEAALVLAGIDKKAAIATLQKKIDSFELLSPYDEEEGRLVELLTHYGYVNWILTEQLKVGRVEGSDFVNVEYVSENPFLSAYVVNTLCEETIRHDNFLGTDRAGQSVQFFANLLNERQKVLDERTQALDQFRTTHRDYERGSVPGSTIGLAELEDKRSVTSSNIHRLRLSLENVNRKLDKTPRPRQQYDANSNVIRIKKEMDELNASPNVKEPWVQDKLKELSDRLQAELGMLEEMRKPPTVSREELEAEQAEHEIELKVAQRELNSLDVTLGTMRRNMSTGTTDEALQRQVDKASEEYLDVLDRYNIEKSKASITSPLQLAIRGQPNSFPEFPKRYLVIAMAGAAGFFLCVFIIVFREYTDVRLKTPERLALKTRLTVAAAIETINTRGLNLNELFFSRKRKSLEVFKNHLRKLRFEIDKSGGQVLLVTSTASRQGKTFITLCLSYLLAMLKKKVIIIDTNFRHNSLTQVLSRKNRDVIRDTRGKRDTGGDTGGTAVMPVKANTQVAEAYPGTFNQSVALPAQPLWIEIIGNSGRHVSPAEIFTDRDFGETISILRQYYDYIIMEGPALNDYADSRELAEYADKVIPVFSAESSIGSDDKESIEYLRQLDGKLVGSVLNNVNSYS